MIISTGTASGKSLAYLTPAVAACFDGGTVLYLTPTKALAADQLRGLRELRITQVRAACFDGDTPFEERTWIRQHANYVLTNPDMLHRSLLPRHSQWSSFFRRLRMIVVDECHGYRGVFGSHVAQILRRLRRVCSRYGSRPTFILASATASEPGVFAKRLTGLEMDEVTTDASPKGSTTIALWEPPLTELRGEGGAPVRRTATAEAADLLADLVLANVRTLAFIRSRRGAETVAMSARAKLQDVAFSLSAHHTGSHRHPHSGHSHARHATASHGHPAPAAPTERTTAQDDADPSMPHEPRPPASLNRGSDDASTSAGTGVSAGGSAGASTGAGGSAGASTGTGASTSGSAGTGASTSGSAGTGASTSGSAGTGTSGSAGTGTGTGTSGSAGTGTGTSGSAGTGASTSGSAGTGASTSGSAGTSTGTGGVSKPKAATDLSAAVTDLSAAVTRSAAAHPSSLSLTPAGNLRDMAGPRAATDMDAAAGPGATADLSGTADQATPAAVTDPAAPIGGLRDGAELQDAAELPDKIAAYRAGYLAEDRRLLEKALRSGTIMGLATTNALELGVDVSGLDAVLIAGWPGTRASLWQQVGRAGRAGQDALAVLIARDDPLDTYIVHHPDALFGQPVEAIVLDPDNPYVLGPHLCVAAAEIPLTEDDLPTFGDTAADVLADLVSQGLLRRRPNGWFWTKRERATDLADIRGGGGTLIQVVESSTGRLLGSVDEPSAHTTVHTGAVYLHQGETFLVEHLDLDAGVALVSGAAPDYSTFARDITDISIISAHRSHPLGPGTLHFGEVEVTRQVVSYLKRRIQSGEMVGDEPLDLPPRTLRTRAIWWTLPADVVAPLAEQGFDLGGSAHAAEHAAIGLLPLFATCDRWDIGGVSTELHADTGQLTVFVYDGHAGGAGFAERGYARATDWLTATREAIASCECDRGCPSCIQSPKCGNGNDPLDKRGAIHLLDTLLTPPSTSTT
uniref:DEAD/DEAH box helicase n=1 Tax=Nonomuraea pusilla TaxID=46177 RepID=UPI001F45BF18|nr:DEAD/DEAH box helicase [Nonomuraea pusilla]